MLKLTIICQTLRQQLWTSVGATPTSGKSPTLGWDRIAFMQNQTCYTPMQRHGWSTSDHPGTCYTCVWYCAGNPALVPCSSNGRAKCHNATERNVQICGIVNTIAWSTKIQSGKAKEPSGPGQRIQVTKFAKIKFAAARKRDWTISFTAIIESVLIRM